MRLSKEEPLAESWLKYPRAAISPECCRAAAVRRDEIRSGASPCCARSELMSESTPCSSADIAALGWLAVAPAGEAAMHMLNAVSASATRRVVRLPMHHESARPAHRRHPSNELPRSRHRLSAAVAQPVQE